MALSLPCWGLEIPAYAADIALKGFSVNLAEISGFEETLRAIEKKGGIELSGKSGNGFAELNMITTDLAAAVKGVDIIIIGGSAFAHEPFDTCEVFSVVGACPCKGKLEIIPDGLSLNKIGEAGLSLTKPGFRDLHGLGRLGQQFLPV